MDIEKKLISNKIFKPSYLKGKVDTSYKTSTTSEITKTEPNHSPNSKTKPIQKINFIKSPAINANSNKNNPCQRKIPIPINKREFLQTQRTTLESFYENKAKTKTKDNQSNKTLMRYPTFIRNNPVKNNASQKNLSHSVGKLERNKSTQKGLFSIDTEDQMFNNFKIKIKKTKKVKKKIKKKPKLKENEVRLQTVYHINKDSEKQIKMFKKAKNHFSLQYYQTKLIGLNKNVLSEDSIKKLGKTFLEIRSVCSKRYDDNYSALRELEFKEKKIIDRVNYQNNALTNILNMSKYKSEKERLVLPELQFTRVVFKHKPKAVPPNKTKVRVNQSSLL